MRGVLNAEGYFALAWLMVLLLRSRKAGTFAAEYSQETQQQWWWLLLMPLAFLPFLAFPFLADDYPHILHARALTWSGIPALFTVPAADRFFRPLVYLSYALDAHWAGMTPWLWRSAGLLLHLANTLLVYVLLSELRFPALPAICGAMLFGVHGSRPEAVTWVAARFDLLAVFFGLLCLISTLRGSRVMASLCLLCAVLSKESAFVVPLLAVAVLWYRQRALGGPAISRGCVLPLFSVAAAVFAYRWWLLGGVGGYRDAVNGTPTVFLFKWTSSLQALLPRFWGTLLFPVNWSRPAEWWLLGLMGICAAALLWLAAHRADRRQLLLGVAFAYVCAIPVHQFLSIGADLEKSRVLYFASVGLAVIFASAIGSRRTLIPAACILLFQFAALHHNLEIWKQVGYRARQACTAGAHGLPNVVDGVYFLHTGYPECLEFQ